MTGVEQIVVISVSSLSALLSVATIVTLRKGRHYGEQTAELWDEAARKWEALAEQLRARAAKGRTDDAFQPAPPGAPDDQERRWHNSRTPGHVRRP
jgi:hypothetical protein